MGYDISDYNDIDPRYGKLADVDDLIAGLKQRGMKLMMDLVVNHTSNLHDWFLESRSSKQSPKRDWYIWQPPKYDDKGNRKPPNNWAMLLGKNVLQYPRLRRWTVMCLLQPYTLHCAQTKEAKVASAQAMAWILPPHSRPAKCSI